MIKDRRRLAGLEQTALAVAAQKAVEAGYKHATTAGGPWVFTPDATTYAAVTNFARDRELRKQMYTAYRSLASSGKHDNTPIIRKILTLRRESVQLLGYSNYAESAFTTRVGLQPRQICATSNKS